MEGVVCIQQGLYAVNKLPVNSQAHVATLLVQGEGLGSVNSKVVNGPVMVNVSQGLRISVVGIIDARLLVRRVKRFVLVGGSQLGNGCCQVTVSLLDSEALGLEVQEGFGLAEVGLQPCLDTANKSRGGCAGRSVHMRMVVTTNNVRTRAVFKWLAAKVIRLGIRIINT
jgi:hypothetical protein